MVYNEQLAEKVRGAFQSIPRVEEKKMMGGLTFMVNGKAIVSPKTAGELFSVIDAELAGGG